MAYLEETEAIKLTDRFLFDEIQNGYRPKRSTKVHDQRVEDPIGIIRCWILNFLLISVGHGDSVQLKSQLGRHEDDSQSGREWRLPWFHKNNKAEENIEFVSACIDKSSSILMYICYQHSNI